MRAVGIGSLVVILVLLGLIAYLAQSHRSLPGIDTSYLSVSAVPGHIAALTSVKAADRKQAADNLWRIGVDAREATPALLLAATDSDPQVREAVVKALGRTGQGTQDAVPALIQALKDEEAGVRKAAATSLAETWQVAKRGIRRDRSQGPPPTILPPPYEALAQQAVPLLTAALRSSEAPTRASAAEALVETGPIAEPAVPDLVQILQKDSDSSVRLQATLALGSIGLGAKAAVPVLVEKLRSEKADGVRVNTAAVLGMIRSSPETVVPALVETFLKDEHPDARRSAMGSIGQFGAEAQIAIPLLREAAKNPKNPQSEELMRNINQLLNHLEGRGAGPGGTAPGNPSSPAQGPPGN